MSRVEENVEAINDMHENLKNVGPEGFLGLMIHKPELVSSIMASSQCDIIVDISKSLAVIADSLSYIVKEESQCKKEREEKWKDKEMPSYPSKSMYLSKVESLLQKAGITKGEWETWVNLRNKYLFGKKEPEE